MIGNDNQKERKENNTLVNNNNSSGGIGNFLYGDGQVDNDDNDEAYNSRLKDRNIPSLNKDKNNSADDIIYGQIQDIDIDTNSKDYKRGDNSILRIVDENAISSDRHSLGLKESKKKEEEIINNEKDQEEVLNFNDIGRRSLNPNNSHHPILKKDDIILEKPKEEQNEIKEENEKEVKENQDNKEEEACLKEEEKRFNKQEQKNKKEVVDEEVVDEEIKYVEKNFVKRFANERCFSFNINTGKYTNKDIDLSDINNNMTLEQETELSVTLYQDSDYEVNDQDVVSNLLHTELDTDRCYLASDSDGIKFLLYYNTDEKKWEKISYDDIDNMQASFSGVIGQAMRSFKESLNNIYFLKEQKLITQDQFESSCNKIFEHRKLYSQCLKQFLTHKNVIASFITDPARLNTENADAGREILLIFKNINYKNTIVDIIFKPMYNVPIIQGTETNVFYKFQIVNENGTVIEECKFETDYSAEPLMYSDKYKKQLNTVALMPKVVIGDAKSILNVPILENGQISYLEKEQNKYKNKYEKVEQVVDGICKLQAKINLLKSYKKYLGENNLQTQKNKLLENTKKTIKDEIIFKINNYSNQNNNNDEVKAQLESLTKQLREFKNDFEKSISNNLNSQNSNNYIINILNGFANRVMDIKKQTQITSIDKKSKSSLYNSFDELYQNILRECISWFFGRQECQRQINNYFSEKEQKQIFNKNELNTGGIDKLIEEFKDQINKLGVYDPEKVYIQKQKQQDGFYLYIKGKFNENGSSLEGGIYKCVGKRQNNIEIKGELSDNGNCIKGEEYTKTIYNTDGTIIEIKGKLDKDGNCIKGEEYTKTIYHIDGSRTEITGKLDKDGNCIEDEKYKIITNDKDKKKRTGEGKYTKNNIFCGTVSYDDNMNNNISKQFNENNDFIIIEEKNELKYVTTYDINHVGVQKVYDKDGTILKSFEGNFNIVKDNDKNDKFYVKFFNTKEYTETVYDTNGNKFVSFTTIIDSESESESIQTFTTKNKDDTELSIKINKQKLDSDELLKKTVLNYINKFQEEKNIQNREQVNQQNSESSEFFDYVFERDNNNQTQRTCDIDRYNDLVTRRKSNFKMNQDNNNRPLADNEINEKYLNDNGWNIINTETVKKNGIKMNQYIAHNPKLGIEVHFEFAKNWTSAGSARKAMRNMVNYFNRYDTMYKLTADRKLNGHQDITKWKSDQNYWRNKWKISTTNIQNNNTNNRNNNI